MATPASERARQYRQRRQAELEALRGAVTNTGNEAGGQHESTYEPPQRARAPAREVIDGLSNLLWALHGCTVIAPDPPRVSRAIGEAVALVSQHMDKARPPPEGRTA